MSERDLNPYTPPEEFEAAQLPGGLWRIGSDGLHFRDGAKLPMVDVFSGRTGDDLIPVSQEFVVQRSGGAAVRSLVFLAIVGVYLVGAYFGIWALPEAGFFIVVLVISISLQLVGRHGSLKGRLSWYVDAGADGVRQRWRTAATVSWLVGLVVLLGFGFSSTRMGWLPVGMILALLLIVGASLGMRFLPALRCRGARDGWFHLKGIVPEAIRTLEGLQETENLRVIEAAEETRTRKGFTVYLHRFPFSLLLRHQWWNPVLALVMLGLKLSRSKKLEREQFHASEAEDIQEGELDPGLKEVLEQARQSAAFVKWRTLAVNRLPAPAGDLRTDCVVMVSPGLEYSLALAVVRVSTGSYSREIVETSFRSWGVDGTVWISSNTPLVEPWPDWIAAQRVKGGLEDVWNGHLRRISGVSLQAAGNAAEILSRLDIEVEERRAAFEQAGFYGPVRAIVSGSPAGMREMDRKS